MRRIVRVRILNHGCIISDIRSDEEEPCSREACKIEIEELENHLTVETFYVEE